MLSVNKENRNKASIHNPEFKFYITAENLKPELSTDLVTLSNHLESSFSEIIKPFGKLLLPILTYFMGFIVSGGLFILGLLIKLSIDNESYNILNFNLFFSNFDFWSLFILATWILEIPLLLFCVFSILEYFRKKEKVKKGFQDNLEELPENILKRW